MSRRSEVPPPDDLPLDAPPDDAPGALAPGRGAVADLAMLPIAGITRRRLGGLIALGLAAWIVLMFVRQVNEAAAATGRVEALADGNVAARTMVAMLERERDLIARQRYLEQQARAYGLGTPREVAFTLDQNAPPLPADAPGSATVSLGAEAADVEPLERWLTILFGPTD